MHEMFSIEQLEEVTAPLSNDFWTGASIGFGAVLATAALFVAMAT